MTRRGKLAQSKSPVRETIALHLERLEGRAVLSAIHDTSSGVEPKAADPVLVPATGSLHSLHDSADGPSGLAGGVRIEAQGSEHMDAGAIDQIFAEMESESLAGVLDLA